MEEKKRGQIRQGDVLLIPVEKPQEDGLYMPIIEGKPVVEIRVAGERTGHAHVLPATVYAAQIGTIVRTYAYIAMLTMLTHQEHENIPIPEGWWEVRQQREFLGRRLD